MASATEDAARVRPPDPNNNNEAALGAGVASGELDLFAATGPDVPILWITLNCTNAFNFLCGESGMAAPSNLGFFAGGSSVQFRATRNKHPFLRVIMPDGGSFKWWISGP